MTKQAQLEQLLEAEITSLNYEFIGCVLMQQNRNLLLRVYIDKPGGIKVEDCTKVTRHVSSILDVEDILKEHYVLEISSPGLERPLFKPAHYQQALGKRIKLKLQVPHNGRRNFTGVLQQADTDKIILLVDQETVELPYFAIEKAHIDQIN